jgi:microcystin degradation protein MlrC
MSHPEPRLRVALGGFSHETNSFSPHPADQSALDAAPLLRGEEIVAAHIGSRSPTAGFLDAAEQDGQVDVVPLVSASLTPMGLVTDDVFELVVGQLVEGLTDGGPWDAVYLDLHGAGVSRSHPDMDGEILRRVRRAVGPDTVVATTLDMHANVSPLMIQQADLVNLYQTNPHLDTRERATECARLAFAAARGDIRPVQHVVQLPLAINILRQGTDDDPVRSLLAEARRITAAEGLLFLGIGLGYPYSDSPKMGATVVALGDHDREATAAAAERLARQVWDRRDDLQGQAPTAAEAADIVADRPGPIVLLDVGDNVGGGTGGDSTVLPRALRDRGVDGVFLVLTDAAAAAAAHAAGEGASVSLRAGGRSAEGIGEPFPIQGTVRSLSDGRFTQRGTSHGGRPHQHVGPTAVIDVPGFGDVMLTTLPFMPFSVEPYAAVGVEIERFRVIVAKGVIAPRAAFTSIAREFLLVDTPGISTADFQRFDYTHRRSPMFPFEPDTTFEDRVSVGSDRGV